MTRLRTQSKNLKSDLKRTKANLRKALDDGASAEERIGGLTVDNKQLSSELAETRDKLRLVKS